jgi:CDP-6-deoxy-D-xylo-4-hexulose-3-dehydrase
MPTTTTAAAKLNWPLMKNNIAREDLDAVVELLQQDDPILTQSKHVRAFEEEWSAWLGVRTASSSTAARARTSSPSPR